MNETSTTIAERVGQHQRGDYRVGRQAYRASLIASFETSLLSPPRMSGSEWAERYGWIPKGTGAENGPVTLYGYQRGLMDAMCDPRVPLVTVLKAARVGYTRCAALAIAYHLHHDPTSCAIAQPTQTYAENFGGEEIAPMLRETPALRPLLRPVRKGHKQDKNVFFQLLNGASVRLVGAAADDAFRQYSAQFQFADEVDAEGWTPTHKTQGDKLTLFWTRGETFWNRKQVRGSTPLLEETSRVARLWAASDRRRYFVPCPDCGAMQYLDWGGPDIAHGLKWNLKENGRLDTVWYVGTCGHLIDESYKFWMDARGEWRATNPDGDHAGFHLWTGMSLNLNAAWPVIVQEWLDAQKDPATLIQPFVNLRLGRTYRVTYGQEIKASQFMERLEDFDFEVPAWAEFITLGGDVQSGANARIEAGVYAWGRGLECALIGHFVILGDPGQGEVWSSLDALLKRSFTRSDGRVMAIQGAAIDSGGHHTVETYAFCNERRSRRIWAIKGKSEVMGRRSRVWPRMPSQKLGNVWFMISGNAARDWVYGSLAIDKPGPRFVHFPRNPAVGSRPIDDDFFGQLTAERLVVRRQGFTEWEKPKEKAREAGVCLVYAYAAVAGLQATSGLFVAKGKMPDASVLPPQPAQPDDPNRPRESAPPVTPTPTPSPTRPVRRVTRSSYMR